jgi:hypothetical protein
LSCAFILGLYEDAIWCSYIIYLAALAGTFQTSI